MITITVDVDGNAVSRQFVGVGTEAWNTIVENMLDTIENSKTLPF